MQRRRRGKGRLRAGQRRAHAVRGCLHLRARCRPWPRQRCRSHSVPMRPQPAGFLH
jgi:hypothetical protein